MTHNHSPTWATGHQAALEYHRELLGDPVRMRAFERAISALVLPGDIVLDLGCGTAILAMLAARAGASRVYAVESVAPIAELARELVHDNGLHKIIDVIAADALTIQLPGPVDLILSEFMGHFVLDDGMFPVVRSAARWMHANTRFCPSHLQMMLAPVGDFALPAVDLFQDPICDLDFSAAHTLALESGYPAHLEAQTLMSPGQSIATLTPPHLPTRIEVEQRWEIQRSGRLQGVAGWFEAELAPGVELTTAPGPRTHWGQYLFPLPPTRVQPGDILELRLFIEEREELVWNWEGRIRVRG